ncbi:40S ribosomal protein S6-like [Prionailurus bengalensis]|uniref:40S ribosomal protein S6-like n=1 Tax=Prionailurus bengalensis TaxID=37029 RepID=UPI001CA7D86D|nr:40S ribosomal protein S6-like [Prionailurus bengalensis]
MPSVPGTMSFGQGSGDGVLAPMRVQTGLEGHPLALKMPQCFMIGGGIKEAQRKEKVKQQIAITVRCGHTREAKAGGDRVHCAFCHRIHVTLILTTPLQRGVKLNLSFPATGCQKLIRVDNKCKFRTFYEKHMTTEVAADALTEEWKGCMVPISGGNYRQGFSLRHGVLTHDCVCLLLCKGHSRYRPRRTEERKHKSFPGWTVDVNLSVLNLIIVKKQNKTKQKQGGDIPRLTDITVPCLLGPKRRMKKAKEKHREQIAKTQRLFFLEASTSKLSLVKNEIF